MYLGSAEGEAVGSVCVLGGAQSKDCSTEAVYINKGKPLAKHIKVAEKRWKHKQKKNDGE